VPPAGVVTLSGVIAPARRCAASFGVQRRRRPACRSPSWQAGGTSSVRPGSPGTGDAAGGGPAWPGRARPDL